MTAYPHRGAAGARWIDTRDLSDDAQDLRHEGAILFDVEVAMSVSSARSSREIIVNFFVTAAEFLQPKTPAQSAFFAIS